MNRYACLNIVNGIVNISYFSCNELGRNSLISRRIFTIFPENLPTIGGNYVIFAYTDSEHDVPYNIPITINSLRSLKCRIKNILEFLVTNYGQVIIVKYSSNLANMIDITLGDPIFDMIEQKFTPELQTQMNSHRAS